LPKLLYSKLLREMMSKPSIGRIARIGTMALNLEHREVASLGQARVAQQIWARTSLRRRLALLRRARHRMAASADTLARSVPCDRPGALHRSVADTLVSEVLPLVEACRFLEREARWILSPQQLSARNRPFWLRGTRAETRREPIGVVLIIAPANYPLFLPGVQVLQALAAGNAVLWKPAPGGSSAATALRDVLVGSGLDPALLQLLDESNEAAAEAIAVGVDKVILTGSAATGATVLRQLASNHTPAVMELSGCDAVFVLPGANVERAVAAVSFGLRFNGSATCMAPRRLFLVGDQRGFLRALLEQLKSLPVVPLPLTTRAQLAELFENAQDLGGSLLVDELPDGLRYALILAASAEMKVAQSDIFAPVLSVFQSPNADVAALAHAHCPYALTAAIFGPEHEANALASRLPVGTVLINDLIVATADPRIAFGGRASSGFGLTRGREGLLEMTVLKTVVTQRSKALRPYRPTTPEYEPFFVAYLQMVHGGSWRERWNGLRRLMRAATRLD
jgi:acyl-CoA reductase-like NAD-dependent aldehyde dehydrogenase